MTVKLSVVINTLNEEKNIERAIKSVSFADEILVCDMNSDDKTAVISKRLGAKIIFHRRVGYVEPARDFAISKAEGEWILIIDADEEIPDSLGDKIKELIYKESVLTHVEIPRKNIIFGKTLKASMWWPDYHTRLFKKGFVDWGNKIHSKPKTQGQGLTLEAQERWAITHYHYSSISQFLERMDRYSTIQARELRDTGYEFDYRDLVKKPLNEFLSRFFAHRGFDDGLHGLALGLLQAFSFLVVYLKVWEMRGFSAKEVKFEEINEVFKGSGEELSYWMKYGNLSRNPLKRTMQKIKNRFSI